MKNRNILYFVFALLMFGVNTLHAAEILPLDQKDSMKVLQSGEGWSKLEFVDKSIFASDQKKSLDGKMLPGQDQLYVIYNIEGARNAPLPEDERQELIYEMQNSRDGGLTIYHAGIIDAVKLGSPSGYEIYAEGSPYAKGGCNSWHYRTKTFSGDLGDLSESVDVYNSSNDNYSIDVDLDVSGAVASEFSAAIQYKYKKSKWWQLCIPYKFRIVDYHLQGDMTVDDLLVNLEGTLQANLIDKTWQLTKINAGEAWFWVGPIPVRLGLRIPIDAALKADITLAGEVGVQSHGTGRVKFDKLCNSNFVCVDQTPSINNWNSVIDSTQIVVGLDAQLKARASLGVSLLPYLYSEWFLSAKVGVSAGVDAWLWGYIGNSCGNADSTGGNEWVSALTLDADFDIRGIGTWKALGGTHTIGFLNDKVFYETHIAFFDLLPGGSSALQPMLQGSGNQGSSGNYSAKMRPCVPFTDNVNYHISWDDGAVQNFSSAPTTNYALSHTWFAPGPYTVELTALSDAHGRNFNATTSRVIETNALPIASFTYSCSGFVCTFDASNSSDSDGTITNYAWSFGATGVTATKTYTSNGLNSATLTVTDNSGASRSTTRYFFVQAITIGFTRTPAGYIINWSSNDPSINSVNVYRDGVIVGNDSSGAWLDTASSPFISYRYKVCKTGSTTICSLERRTKVIIIGPIEEDDDSGDVPIGIQSDRIE